MKVIRLDKDWYEKDRKPAADAPIVAKKRPGLAKRYFSVRVWAERLGVSVKPLYEAIHAQTLDVVPVGKRGFRISEEAIEDWMMTEKSRRGMRMA